MEKEVLAVKISRSLNDYTKGKDYEYFRESVLECTRKYWKIKKSRSNDVGLVIGIKDGVIYSAFEVVSHTFDDESKRVTFECDKSRDDLIGRVINNGTWTTRYFSIDEIESLREDKYNKQMVEDYYKLIQIPYR